jgi:hypothetical protein
MMTIKPELPAYFRTLVRGDNATNDQIEAKLDAEGWDGFPRFLAALFFVAVDRRFGEDATRADVIKFVADMRAGLGDDGPEVNAEAAENLIFSIIDPSVDYDIHPQMIGRIQAATVNKVLAEGDLTDQELDAVLSEAVELASRE